MLPHRTIAVVSAALILIGLLSPRKAPTPQGAESVAYCDGCNMTFFVSEPHACLMFSYGSGIADDGTCEIITDPNCNVSPCEIYGIIYIDSTCPNDLALCYGNTKIATIKAGARTTVAWPTLDVPQVYCSTGIDHTRTFRITNDCDEQVPLAQIDFKCSKCEKYN